MHTINRRTLTVGFWAVTLATAIALTFVQQASAQWHEFGGPNRDFKVKATGLSDAWPQGGPKQLWSRELGDGYSGIVADKDRLFTMSRTDDLETVYCLDADTGKTVWEHAYEATVPSRHVRDFGTGPRAAPTLAGSRLYTMGVSGIMHCLNKKTGKVYWTRKLVEELGGTFLPHGYASSPLIHKRLVIVPIGGPGHSFVALDRRNGKTVWKRHDFANSYSSPKMIEVDGQDQLLCFMGSEIVGLNPDSGDLLWSHAHGNRYKQNVCMPVWGDDNILFITSVQGGGARGLKLTRQDGQTQVEELWHNPKVQVHHSNAIRVGDYVYTSTGGRGSGFLHAVNVKTGEVAWKKRGFAKSTLLHTGDRFLVLDENGVLGQIRATPEDMEVLSQATVLANPAWTVPTLIGTRLYVRDRKTIKALDLS